MWLKWLPWRFFVRKLARSHGFLDPVSLFAQLSRFSQPSEVALPVELMRLGTLLQARGLINSQAIQHNLDWVWPYWVTRQFDPTCESFIPRAFSLTHINLSHRNWTAVGLPGVDKFPIVDPRGLVTPHYDGWSLDNWILDEGGEDLIPSKLDTVEQKLKMTDEELAVLTVSEKKGNRLVSEVRVEKENEKLLCTIKLRAISPRASFLSTSLRPANPEGVSFLHHISSPDNSSWLVNGKDAVVLGCEPFKILYSHYKLGDVYNTEKPVRSSSVKCSVGMATAMALFPLEAGKEKELEIKIPLHEENTKKVPFAEGKTDPPTWHQAVKNVSKLKGARKDLSYIYEASIRSIILHSPGEVYPGPYTYKHFWFRDAAFIVNAMLHAGLTNLARRTIELFFQKQRFSGFFRSQAGEWDSNGQVLWVIGQYLSVTGEDIPSSWISPIKRGADWICSKRISDKDPHLHAGLLPSGFSAEHFGPNDYYYWDDLWAVSGLRSASSVMRRCGEEKSALKFDSEARAMQKAIHKSLDNILSSEKKIMPSSPYRRPDSASIGSLVAGYPLQLLDSTDPLLTDTAEYLLNKYIVKGGFYHDMSHSGINPYLTLHLAQVLLIAGDKRFWGLLQATADLASPTGQWPEAVNPRSLGGCMGDGQHVWASAEWIMMIHSCFVREENDRLILAAGINSEWFDDKKEISYGPVGTSFGTITVRLFHVDKTLKANWSAQWRKKPDEIMLAPVEGTSVTVPGNAENAECTLR